MFSNFKGVLSEHANGRIVALVLSFLLYRTFRKWVDGSKAVGWVPGQKVLFKPLDLLGALIPTYWWNPGVRFTWDWRHSVYNKSETISFVPLLLGKSVLYTNNLDVARQVVAGGVKAPWIKPESASRALLLWGMNLIASEKDTWRRHRRIMGQGFNSRTYSLVWSETQRIYREMLAGEGWSSSSSSASDKDSPKGIDHVDINAVQDYTFKVTLAVITSCGFGLEFKWDEPPMDDKGRASVQEALKLFTDHAMLFVIAPEWFFKLPGKWIRNLVSAREVLRDYMQKQVRERKAALTDADGQERSDVFSLLVRANEEDGKFTLDADELIGNIFGLLFAGHESTAHVLAATLGFLAIYPDMQKEVYEEIVNVVGLERDTSFDDFNNLEKVLSVFYEALRLFPPGYLMIRQATEDTILTIPNARGEEGTRTIAIQKGAEVVVDMVGVHYNPRHFPEPNKYKPSRWYGNLQDLEAMTAFSIGPRACIGRKFAAIEAVCFLTLLLQDWHVEPAPSSMKPGETGEEWKERMMDAKVFLTLGPGSVPVRLVRRER